MVLYKDGPNLPNCNAYNKTGQVEHEARTVHITEYRVSRYADLFVFYLATLSASEPHIIIGK